MGWVLGSEGGLREFLVEAHDRLLDGVDCDVDLCEDL
jgi:hypothetical protein